MLPSQIVRLIEKLSAHRGRSPHTVGRFVGGQGDFYARLRSGSDITTRKAARAAAALSDAWPDDLPWPSDIPRPAPSPDRDAE